LTIKIPITQRK